MLFGLQACDYGFRFPLQLSSSANKQQLIDLLSSMLQSNGCITYHAKGDADVLIVTTAVEAA